MSVLAAEPLYALKKPGVLYFGPEPAGPRSGQQRHATSQQAGPPGLRNLARSALSDGSSDGLRASWQGGRYVRLWRVPVRPRGTARPRSSWRRQGSPEKNHVQPLVHDRMYKTQCTTILIEICLQSDAASSFPRRSSTAASCFRSRRFWRVSSKTAKR